MSRSEDQEKEYVKLERFLIKEGRKELCTEMQHLDQQGLEQKLLSQAMHLEAIETQKQEDDELRKAKDKVRDLGASYREQTRMAKKISRYISLLMKEQ